ncbi:MAG: tRNA (adenosine(37)-N6)-threonylcarbamoyltransferase complex transferase subunit TsaD [Bacteroidetes bacterium]|nr:tRNA (adenosine(37)-N6)-threonylcarbamoyltransferase complex transferase subunit TsaD [Bacteroidota bacterium]
MNKDRIILAIESSCDDTAAAIMINGKIHANFVATQKIHEQYGGVVPELAGRAHQSNLVPLVTEALKKAGIDKKQLSAVAFTKGPGLIGALMVGSSFAKSLAQSLSIPLIGVHHMEAHVLAHFIDEPRPQFPFLCLTVSGGHTQLVLMKDYFEQEIIGKTIDDAAGEAFDKTAKILGLPYPGGPVLDKLASTGNPKAFEFPVSRMPGFDFSFSGLKTSVLYFIRDKELENPEFKQQNLNDLCASIQSTIIKQLLKKTELAAKEYGIRQLALAGGVSANSGLRKELTALCEKHKWQAYVPAFEYCTDNAGMIAMAADLKFQRQEFETMDTAPFARS